MNGRTCEVCRAALSRLRRRICAGVVLAASLASGPAFAGQTQTLKDVLVVTPLAGGTTASLLFPVFFLPAFVGEVGTAAAYGASTAGDPPDTVNYGQRADEPLLIPTIPPTKGASSAYNFSLRAYVREVSQLVQTSKDMYDTIDRIAGAKAAGNTQDVAKQERWLAEFTAVAIKQYQLSQADLAAYASHLQAEFPAVYNFVIPVSDVLTTKNAEAAGNFPTAEANLISFWQLNPSEVQYEAQVFIDTPDSAIIALGSLSVGQLLMLEATPVATSSRPAP